MSDDGNDAPEAGAGDVETTNRGCRLAAAAALVVVVVTTVLLGKSDKLTATISVVVTMVLALAACAAALALTRHLLREQYPQTRRRLPPLLALSVPLLVLLAVLAARAEILHLLVFAWFMAVGSGVGLVWILRGEVAPGERRLVTGSVICFHVGLAWQALAAFTVLPIAAGIGDRTIFVLDAFLAVLAALASSVGAVLAAAVLARRGLAWRSRRVREALMGPCPGCGEEIVRQAKKCKHCKHTLTAREQRELVYGRLKAPCPMCLEPIPASAAECEHCSHVLTQKEQDALLEMSTSRSSGRALAGVEAPEEISPTADIDMAHEKGVVAGVKLLPREKIVDRIGQSILETQSLLRWNTAVLTSKRIILAFSTLLTQSNRHIVELKNVTAMSVRREFPWAAIALVSLTSVGSIVSLALSGLDEEVIVAGIVFAVLGWGVMAALLALFGSRTGLHMAIPGVPATGADAGGCGAYVALLVFPPLGVALYILRSPFKASEGGFYFSDRGFRSGRLQRFIDHFFELKAGAGPHAPDARPAGGGGKASGSRPRPGA